MPTEISDDIILQQFREPLTREQAFTGLVNKYSRKLYMHIRGMVLNHEDANDVLQNVFIKVWNSLAGFRHEAQLYTWLYRIAANECLSFLNAQKRKATAVLDEQQLAHRLKSDPYFEGDEIQLTIRLAIETLPDKQKQVFQMRYYNEMPYEEMAAVLETSVGALKASFHHAVKKVEEFVKRRLNH